MFCLFVCYSFDGLEIQKKRICGKYYFTQILILQILFLRCSFVKYINDYFLLAALPYKIFCFTANKFSS